MSRRARKRRLGEELRPHFRVAERAREVEGRVLHRRPARSVCARSQEPKTTDGLAHLIRLR